MYFCSHFIKTHLINTKLFIKILLCEKHAFREVLSVSKKIIFRECKKMKEFKNVIIK